MVRFIKFLWIILVYTAIAFFLSKSVVVLSFLTLTFAGLLFREKYSVAVWFQIDELVAAVAHFKKNRTVSGLCGEYAYQEKPGFIYLERLINKIFNDNEHCYNRWVKEMKILNFIRTL
ncbi:hypothetical protein CL622_04485 [archaeon]|nr:hypothetical protein [archaeon]